MYSTAFKYLRCVVLHAQAASSFSKMRDGERGPCVDSYW